MQRKLKFLNTCETNFLYAKEKKFLSHHRAKEILGLARAQDRYRSSDESLDLINNELTTDT